MLKHIDRSKGFGFIQCDEVHERYNSDVFVRVCDLFEHKVGDCVCFSLGESKRGQPQGTKLKLHEESLKETTTGNDKATPASHMFGTVKSFDAGQGYGFISCEETLVKYGRDVFVHKNQLLDFTVGDQVSFCVKMNSDGHPRAHNLSEIAIPPDWLADCQHEAAERLSVPSSSEKHIGTVKNINELKAFGFIECEALFKEFGRDVFFPLSLLPGLSKGEQIEFKARVRNGQPQAYSIARVEMPSHPVAKVQEKVEDPDSLQLTKKLLRACASSQKDSYNRMFELLHAGADPNGRDVTGQTALMVCALNVAQSERKCRLLVGMGGDVNAAYKSGMTVLQWAQERLSHRFAEHLAALSRGEQIDCLISLDLSGSSEV